MGESRTGDLQQREVAIFWDFENVSLPSNCCAAVAAKAIRNAVAPYGRIVDRRLYYDFSKSMQKSSSLDSSGFDLVNTPSRNQKETLDKKMIADVLTFAWDSAVRSLKKPCVVLITGDGDYAYTISKLRDRGIMTVVMVGSNCSVASILVDTADEALSLEKDVLNKVQDNGTTLSVRNKPLLTASPAESDMLYLVCYTLRSLAGSSHDGWIDMGRFATLMQQLIRSSQPLLDSEQIKQRTRFMRNKAQANGYLELGRRKKGAEPREIVPGGFPHGEGLSLEIYGRLLPAGEYFLKRKASLSNKPRFNHCALEGSKKPTKEAESTFFMRNLPQNMMVTDFVLQLQTTLNVLVSRALIEINNGSPVAIVELTQPAKLPSNFLVAQSRVQVFSNKRPSIFLSCPPSKENNPSRYYESQPKEVPSCLQYSTNQDKEKFCLAVAKAAITQATGDWVNAGTVGMSFRSLLPDDFLREASKDRVNQRFREARNVAIEESLVEMGKRKKMETSYYVPVPLHGRAPFGNGLSSEVYFRLLSRGSQLVEDGQWAESVTSTTYLTDSTSHNDDSGSNKFIRMSNLPVTANKESLAEFLASMNTPAHHIEWDAKNNEFEDATIGARVELVDPQAAKQLIDQREVTFCGRRIYIVPDDQSKAVWNLLQDDDGNSSITISFESKQDAATQLSDDMETSLPPPPPYSVALGFSTCIDQID